MLGKKQVIKARLIAKSNQMSHKSWNRTKNHLKWIKRNLMRAEAQGAQTHLRVILKKQTQIKTLIHHQFIIRLTKLKKKTQ